jgi:hypothetical protein
MTTPATRWPAALAAVDAGARQVQGTLNGLGERCGNANLTTLIPTLLLKEPYASRFETGVTPGALAGLTRVSRMLDDILNRVPLRQAPYVGASAFAHKAGLHASAILKDPATYEHIDPARWATPASSRCRTRPGSRTCAAAGRGGDRGRPGRPGAGAHPRRGQGARGRGLCLRHRAGQFRAAGAARTGPAAALLRGQALPRHGRAAQEQVRPDGDACPRRWWW